MTSLAVSIINYRTGDMTIRCLASVRAALGSRAAEVIVVDNASGDGSAEDIGAWIETTGDARFRLIRSEVNSGFSGGHNQGMAAAPDADFYLILNSDALLREDFFDALLPATEGHPRAGFFAPQLEWEDGEVQPSCFRFGSWASEMMRGAKTAQLTALLKNRVVALPLPPDPDQIEWASFACILLRARMVREIGPMDEGYFLYFEDAEYALRGARAGWRVVHVPKARAVHLRGGSGPVKSLAAKGARMPRYYWRSRTRFFRQAHGVTGPLLANLAWGAGRGIAQARRLFGKPVPGAGEGEWRDMWTNLTTPLRPDDSGGRRP